MKKDRGEFNLSIRNENSKKKMIIIIVQVSPLQTKVKHEKKKLKFDNETISRNLRINVLSFFILC